MQRSGMWGQCVGKCRGNVVLRKCPERARDFSPTCSVAECGVIRTIPLKEF
ncbi:hypothetical protein Barb4_01104 [Bacteroidales bacterium Barb4]|nr:hypothetical protein Barb4_01104 [Bacteroidales bacterium Barb4]